MILYLIDIQNHSCESLTEKQLFIKQNMIFFFNKCIELVLVVVVFKNTLDIKMNKQIKEKEKEINNQMLY